MGGVQNGTECVKIPSEINVELLMPLLKGRFADFLKFRYCSYVLILSKLGGPNVPKE